MFAIGALTMTIFIMRFVLFRFQESPKFLLSQGRDEEVIRVLQYVARFNGQTSYLTLDMLQCESTDQSSLDSLDQAESAESPSRPIFREGIKKPRRSWREKMKTEMARYGLLFSGWNMTRLTLLTWIIYAFDYWGFTIAGESADGVCYQRLKSIGSYLPTILKRKNSAIHIGIRQTYRDYIIIYSFGIPAVVLGAALVHSSRLGRKWTMVISSALMGVSLFLFSAVNTEASNIGLNGMEYFFQSLFNAVLYGWTAEAFPAPIRGTASGIASFWGRLFSIISPLIAGRLLSSGTDNVLYLAGSGVFVCTLATALLPSSSMRGESL